MSANLYESHKFSEGISRDMRIPERIGARGALDSGVKGFAVEPGFPTFSNIVEDMNIPDKILATGEAGSAVTPNYDPLDPRFQVQPSDLIPIDSPPDTITLDRMQYPDIHTEAADGSKAVTRRRRDRSYDADPSGDSGIVSGGAAATANLSVSLLRMQKRLDALEAENEQRRRRELILYPAIGLYFLFKIFTWIARPKRMAGHF